MKTEERVQDNGYLRLAEALRHSSYTGARRRVFRQLIEALIYEGMVRPAVKAAPDGEEQFTIDGRDRQGQAVSYLCEGRRKLSFGRIRLSQNPVRRVQGDEEREADDLAVFLFEISPFLTEEAQSLPSFIHELEQTLLKDTMARYSRSLLVINSGNRSYEDLEGDVTEAHPYHPCYKSRIGFDLSDNEAYGPEFNPKFKLVWVAVRNDDIEISSTTDLNHREFIARETGESLYRQFSNKLRSSGYRPEDFMFVPVHPWQWREKVSPIFFRYIREGRMVLLGEGEDEYSPQQSIRTLSNRADRYKSNVKISLSITNTSAVRVIGAHHVRNAPVLSEWLGGILERDLYLRDELRLIVLKEVLGVTFRYGKLPVPLRKDGSGTLGAIWRESIHTYLAPGEEAVPFTALCHIATDGRPFIDSWVARQGMREWLKTLLNTAVRPLIHLLYVHGIAMEAHAQNMVLVHNQGVPVRIAVKDLPGGIRFLQKAHEGLALHSLQPADSHHPNAYASSGMESGDTCQVRDFFMDAVFHINFSELAMFLEEHYGFGEREFWFMLLDGIRDYQRSFPQYAENFNDFDLFAEMIEVGQLTVRRLCGEHAARDHKVPNPLFLLNKLNEGGAGDENGNGND